MFGQVVPAGSERKRREFQFVASNPEGNMDPIRVWYQSFVDEPLDLDGRAGKTKAQDEAVEAVIARCAPGRSSRSRPTPSRGRDFAGAGGNDLGDGKRRY
jgi:hypothetical protein